MNGFERRRLRVTAGEVAFVDVGDGPVVVLLHGFPTNADLWRDEIMLLASRMRVIAPDLLGYGASDRPPDASDLDERAQARHMDELLAALGVDHAAVVGHDVGGVVAQLLALDGRVGVDALVLVDSPAFDSWPAEHVRAIGDVPPERQTADVVADTVRRTFEIGMSHPERLDPMIVDAFVEPWREDPAAFFAAARAISGEGLRGRERELEAFDAPALLLWGEDDPFQPPAIAERLSDLLPGSAIALLPGCSHFVMEDAPRTVGPLLFEYLRARYVGEAHRHASPVSVPVYLERPPPEALFDDGVDDGAD